MKLFAQGSGPLRSRTTHDVPGHISSRSECRQSQFVQCGDDGPEIGFASAGNLQSLAGGDARTLESESVGQFEHADELLEPHSASRWPTSQGETNRIRVASAPSIPMGVLEDAVKLEQLGGRPRKGGAGMVQFFGDIPAQRATFAFERLDRRPARGVGNHTGGPLRIETRTERLARLLPAEWDSAGEARSHHRSRAAAGGN